MAEKIRSVRGTQDILPEESKKWQYVEGIAREVAESYGFREIRVPTIEKTGLFVRSVGETTDVVQKEMYTFDKGEESITLRPEGTAGTVRALLQNGMLNDAYPIKLQYNLSCFRHENPQAGRYREFHQFGVECFGAESPIQDAEIIAMVSDMLGVLGVKGVALNINSIGCKACRPAYNKALVDYYKAHYDEICPLCQDRLERNPMRLIDCKEAECQPIKQNAPRALDFLCEDCQNHFDGLKAALDLMEIDYSINPDIVRGLDYYSRTVFEFTTTLIGAQGTICGGGRYDGLVEEMGGPDTPGIGFGMGMERLIMVMEASEAPFMEEQRPILYIGSMSPKEARAALNIVYRLRKEGFYVLCDTMERSVRAQMKYADKKSAGFSCIIGSNELEAGKVEINDMETGIKTEVTISADDFSTFLWSRLEDAVFDAGDGMDSLMDSLNFEEEK